MADISSYLQDILNAVYGEQVRGSIHDAIEIINEATEVCIGTGTAVSSTTSSSSGFFVGSMYINNATYDLWVCTGTNSWTKMGNVKGKGIQSISKTATSGSVDTYTITYDDNSTWNYTVMNGVDGTHGSVWYKGTALTGTGSSLTGFAGKVNDFYLNQNTGYVYVCTTEGGATPPGAAEWDYVMALTGGGGGGGSITVIDSLNSTSSEDALSANQGRVLKNMVDAKANEDDMSAVAFSGSYNDLRSKPTIAKAYSGYASAGATSKTFSVGDNITGNWPIIIPCAEIPMTFTNIDIDPIYGDVTVSFPALAAQTNIAILCMATS